MLAYSYQLNSTFFKGSAVRSENKPQTRNNSWQSQTTQSWKRVWTKSTKETETENQWILKSLMTIHMWFKHVLSSVISLFLFMSSSQQSNLYSLKNVQKSSHDGPDCCSSNRDLSKFHLLNSTKKTINKASSFYKISVCFLLIFLIPQSCSEVLTMTPGIE